MKQIYFKAVRIQVGQPDSRRCMPSEIGSAVSNGVSPGVSRELPQQIASAIDNGLGFKGFENASNPGTKNLL